MNQDHGTGCQTGICMDMPHSRAKHAYTSVGMAPGIGSGGSLKRSLGMAGLSVRQTIPKAFGLEAATQICRSLHELATHGLSLHVIRIVQMHQEVGPAAQLADASHPESPQNIDQLLVPCAV